MYNIIVERYLEYIVIRVQYKNIHWVNAQLCFDISTSIFHTNSTCFLSLAICHGFPWVRLGQCHSVTSTRQFECLSHFLIVLSFWLILIYCESD